MCLTGIKCLNCWVILFSLESFFDNLLDRTVFEKKCRQYFSFLKKTYLMTQFSADNLIYRWQLWKNSSITTPRFYNLQESAFPIIFDKVKRKSVIVLKKLHLYSFGTDQTFPLGIWFDNFWTVTITDDIEKHRTFVDIFL